MCKGERPVCGTCTQNKHQCAGYGDDTSPTEATKDGKKAARRESTSAAAPAVKIKQEAASQQPSRSHLSHTPSTASHNSDSSPTRRVRRQDDDNGMLARHVALETD